MRRIIGVVAVLALLVAIGSIGVRSSAQEVIETPVVSPTYLEVPAPQQEVITTAPSPSYVWVAGHWNRTPDNWQWASGTWVQPPFSNAYWVPGYWQNRGGQYQWESAHWAATNQGVVVAKPVDVPPLYPEVKPAPPAGKTTLTWQPGHWEWRGTWVWTPGAYVETTTSKATWVQGEWIAGANGTWNWSPAHWVAQ